MFSSHVHFYIVWSPLAEGLCTFLRSCVWEMCSHRLMNQLLWRSCDPPLHSLHWTLEFKGCLWSLSLICTSASLRKCVNWPSIGNRLKIHVRDHVFLVNRINLIWYSWQSKASVLFICSCFIALATDLKCCNKLLCCHFSFLVPAFQMFFFNHSPLALETSIITNKSLLVAVSSWKYKLVVEIQPYCSLP